MSCRQARPLAGPADRPRALGIGNMLEDTIEHNRSIDAGLRRSSRREVHLVTLTGVLHPAAAARPAGVTLPSLTRALRVNDACPTEHAFHWMQQLRGRASPEGPAEGSQATVGRREA